MNVNMTPEQRAMLPAVEWPMEAVLRDLTTQVQRMIDDIRDMRARRIEDEFPTSELSGREHDGRAKAIRELQFCPSTGALAQPGNLS